MLDPSAHFQGSQNIPRGVTISQEDTTPGSHNILVSSDWGSQNILGYNDWGSHFIGESKLTATPACRT